MEIDAVAFRKTTLAVEGQAKLDPFAEIVTESIFIDLRKSSVMEPMRPDPNEHLSRNLESRYSVGVAIRKTTNKRIHTEIDRPGRRFQNSRRRKNELVLNPSGRKQPTAESQVRPSRRTLLRARGVYRTILLRGVSTASGPNKRVRVVFSFVLTAGAENLLPRNTADVWSR